MTYKDLLVHLDDAKGCGSRVGAAVRLAARHEAHLTGLYPIVEIPLLNAIREQIPPDIQANMDAETKAQAEAAQKAFKEAAERGGVVFHGDGIISQFEASDRLEDLHWEAYRERYGDIHRLDRILEAEGDTINRYKASKQADVLMLFYLFSADELRDLFARLGYSFERETIPKTIDYYIHRTSHGSTLSRVVHSWILARSDRARSWQLLAEVLESDIADVQGGTTPEGIHLGAMAGTVDLVQRGQTGLEIRHALLRLNPCVPPELQGLRLRVRYRGQWLELQISCEAMTVRTPAGWTGPNRIAFHDEVREFQPGETLRFTCRPSHEQALPGTLAEASAG